MKLSKNSLTEDINCLYCLSETKNKKIKNLKKFHISQCSVCDLVYADRKPKSEELNECYSGYDRNYQVSGISKSKYHKEFKKLNYIYKFKNCLDIGAGNGYLLDILKKIGIKTYFTEIGEELINFIKNKNHNYVKGGMYPESDLKFDLITLLDVIEHTNEPLRMLENCYDLLNKGGIIYISTPNFNSIEKKIFKSKYSVFSYPEHLVYFTKNSLNNFLKKASFSRVSIETHNISLYRFLRAAQKIFKSKNINYSQGHLVNAKVDSLQKIAHGTKIIYLKSFLSYLLKLIGMGNEIKAIYIKK
tara:strand:+ start:73 stop:978 length:906 start_codon:yes stop_codon:yes gene_type:complete